MVLAATAAESPILRSTVDDVAADADTAPRPRAAVAPTVGLEAGVRDQQLGGTAQSDSRPWLEAGALHRVRRTLGYAGHFCGGHLNNPLVVAESVVLTVLIAGLAWRAARNPPPSSPPHGRHLIAIAALLLAQVLVLN